MKLGGGGAKCCQAEKRFSGEGVKDLLAMLPTKKLAMPPLPDDLGPIIYYTLQLHSQL